MAITFPCLDRAAQYQQMALTLATGDTQHLAAFQAEVLRQGLQLIVRMDALHGQPARLGIPQVTGPVGKILQRAEGPRTDARKRPLRREGLDATVDNVQV